MNSMFLWEEIMDELGSIFIEYATRHSYGSEQPVLSWESAKMYKTLKPSNELDFLYSKHINTIIDRVIMNELEIASLTKQRDELLPLLMNGQVSVDQGLYINFVNDFDEKMFVIFDNIRVKKQENNKLTELQFLLLAKMVQ